MFTCHEWAPNTIYLAKDMVVQTILGEVRVELREDGWYFRDNDLFLHALTQWLAEGLDVWEACHWLNDHQAQLLCSPPFPPDQPASSTASHLDINEDFFL